jgi:hypothetical protein
MSCRRIRTNIIIGFQIIRINIYNYVSAENYEAVSKIFRTDAVKIHKPHY